MPERPEILLHILLQRRLPSSVPLDRTAWTLPPYVIPLDVFFCIFLFLYWLAVHPLGHPRPDRARRDLHDDSLMSEVRRYYIYSKEDPMVDFHDVEDHAR
jgi:hypothetical protein